jgi:hypothetical protein
MGRKKYQDCVQYCVKDALVLSKKTEDFVHATVRSNEAILFRSWRVQIALLFLCLRSH